ncbi:(2,3-dihydroxybenzoyl)adenylate synthase [Polyangium jinanense]|uniref:(2,3-dihydroxybenzoyl)adenylate synthase n=1 Tax=Polyangium jinanense TaxID=2829994 RepID=A0A9X3X4H5_9BACT|nr:(2,3-dihydroxybenzoyl)adenylate synthase [Polyangium jinanense]MDC3954006.1 (2,3-dihydroxybenzoyl)adenylate synthase [Polyangium jinanense]MDC3957781.1 (2,3-dihydroxybenzoyl)adenylate synthase [Polyangium jinanense]MDC3978867.1 (2,3-dihydroxybenzoyl)adenylate synthase [Polyangium jinanense]MDC3982038.1 (2,3-dihydroxybenzoyl)adenylate synthase [Polyangium jinanense]
MRTDELRETGTLAGFTPWPADFAERYRRAGYWIGETFGDFLRDRAERFGDRTALVDDRRRLSYRELDARASRLAAGLARLGIKPRDRVVVQLPNIVEFFEVCFALFRLGALPVLALPPHRRAEISYFCQFTEAVAYIIADKDGGFDYRKLAEEIQAEASTVKHVLVAGEPGPFTALESLYDEPAPLPTLAPEDVAFFQLSGGSTGIPKLIPRTHDDYLYSVRASADICALDGDSVFLVALPVAHNFTLSSPGSLGVLHAGGRVVLSRRPSPDEAFRWIEKERVTVTAVVPPLCAVWLEAARNARQNLSSLRLLQVGGSKLSAEVARRVRGTLGCTLQQVFGMAEGLVNYTRLDDPEDVIIETQGRPISADDEVRVVDEDDRDVEVGQVGHLLTRGPYTIRGYYKAEAHNAKAFTRDGFYRTGDVVRRTPAGYLVVEGRAKDQINRGGEKIAAEEIENHLLAHPAVRDVALVAMPDAFLGERSCAVVVPRETPPAPRELTTFLRERGLAAYKIPDRIELTGDLPKTNVGKVDKQALRRWIADKIAQKGQ